MEVQETYFQAWHSLSITPVFKGRLKALVAQKPRYPQVCIQHYFGIIGAQSRQTTWILDHILILVLSNFSQVEKFDK